jgi:hypothetical protein
MQHADNFVLLAKEDIVLQNMTDRLTVAGGYYGMEMNMIKTKVMRISRQLSTIKIMIDQNNKRTWNISNPWVAQ